jgi:hypothetical protein
MGEISSRFHVQGSRLEETQFSVKTVTTVRKQFCSFYLSPWLKPEANDIYGIAVKHAHASVGMAPIILPLAYEISEGVAAALEVWEHIVAGAGGRE